MTFFLIKNQTKKPPRKQVFTRCWRVLKFIYEMDCFFFWESLFLLLITNSCLRMTNPWIIADLIMTWCLRFHSSSFLCFFCQFTPFGINYDFFFFSSHHKKEKEWMKTSFLSSHTTDYNYYHISCPLPLNWTHFYSKNAVLKPKFFKRMSRIKQSCNYKFSRNCTKPSLMHELGLKMSLSAKLFSFLHQKSKSFWHSCVSHSKKKKQSIEDAFLSLPATDCTDNHIICPSETIWTLIHKKISTLKQKIQQRIHGIRKICQINFFRNSRKTSRMHGFCSKRLFWAIPPPAWFFKTNKKSCSDRGLNPSFGHWVTQNREQTAAFYHAWQQITTIITSAVLCSLIEPKSTLKQFWNQNAGKHLKNHSFFHNTRKRFVMHEIYTRTLLQAYDISLLHLQHMWF